MVVLKSLAPSLKRRFQRLLGSRVEVIWLASPDLDIVEGELVWIEDVVFDMALRAQTAIPFGGRLVVEWANIHLEPNSVTDDLRPGRYVMLEMTCLRQDPSETRAFDLSSPISNLPDSWLHGDLSKSQSLILSLGGRICEYNEPGRALTIRAFFPSSLESPLATQDISVNYDLKQLRILLVEDEGYVRDVACEILQSEGYQVLTAKTGIEAMEIFARSGPVQLLLTDVIMPGMNGHDLAERLRSLHPELKTLYMSGYTDGPLVQFDRDEVEQSFIQKPFTLEGLTSKVKEVLDSPRP